MKSGINKFTSSIAIFAFAIAMLLNLSSNIAGELNLNSAYATGTGTSTGTATKDASYKWRWSFPPCNGTRICNGKSSSYTGIQHKCASGSDFQNCDDSSSTCVPNTNCPAP